MSPLYRAVILGARPALHGATSPALTEVDAEHRVLDWLLRAFNQIEGVAITFVGGHAGEEVIERYPGLEFALNREWDTTGSFGSLLKVRLDASQATFVSYADIVIRDWVVPRIEGAKGDVVLAGDSEWLHRYDRRSVEEIATAEKISFAQGKVAAVSVDESPDESSWEFAGLVRLSPAAVDELVATEKSGKLRSSDSMPVALSHLIDAGMGVSVIDMAGGWAELAAPQDLARFVLGTKAESLERLKPLVTAGHIGETLVVTHSEWTSRRTETIERIVAKFGTDRLVARSSALNEDSFAGSSAGKYESVLAITGGDGNELGRAVDRVFTSYGPPTGDDQVLIQTMVESVSGVVMTRTPSSGAPYYVVNFDDSSARTDTVTAGTSADTRTIFVWRDGSSSSVPTWFAGLLEVVRELEKLVGHDSLDIEFALDTTGTCHVLQVRPIAVVHRAPLNDSSVGEAVHEVKGQVEALAGARDGLVGSGLALSG